MHIFYKYICSYDEHFDFPLYFHTVLKANGCWPTECNRCSAPDLLLIKLYKYWNWITICSVVWLFSGEMAYCFTLTSNIADTVECLVPPLFSGMIIIRMLYMRHEMESMKTILRVFVDKIWIKKKSYPFIFKRCIKTMKPTVYIGLSLWSTFGLYAILPVVVILTSGQTWQSTDKGFPFPMMFPYDYQKPFNYIITYLGCLFSGCVCVTQSYAMDAIFALSVSFVSGQFEILHGRIARLIPECHAEWSSYYGYEDTGTAVSLRKLKDLYNKRLDELTLHHNDLLSFCRILENYFRFPLMVNFCISMLQIGLGGFQFLISGKNSIGDFLRFLAYLLSVTGQLYVICTLGTLIITRSKETAQYLFMCNWEGGKISKYSPLLLQHNIDTELEALSSKLPLWRYINYHPTGKDFQRKLMFMILRSHRPPQLTAMKFAIVSLETFTRILSSSLSYFALLKSFLDKEK